MNTVPVESMPKPTDSNGQSSSPANTARITSLDVELKIQGISQGWARGEDAIMKFLEPMVERKTMTITRRPQYYQSESNMAHGNIHSGRFGSARPTATASNGYTGSTHLSNIEWGELGGYKSETLVSAPESVREVVYTTYTTSMESDILDNASALTTFLLVLSAPLETALPLTALVSTVAFWSREDTKWEGTSRLTVVLDTVCQCTNLAVLYIDNKMYEKRNTLPYLYAGVSIWVFAALYKVPLNPFKWRRTIFSLHAPPSNDIAKLVLAENDDDPSTTTRASELSRVRGRKLVASIQQEVDQLLKRWLLWLGTPSLVLYLVYAAATSRGHSRGGRLIDASRSVLHTIGAFQLLPQAIINYRTKSVAWIPITAYMCELLVNIYRMLAVSTFGSPAFFAPVLGGINQIYCLLLVVFAVQWAKYYKAKQD
ncbi:hypothetical protein GQ54DRAFT_94688 [Martensiomyces pterosporus]|nr:hypothetical protein GQ54DRAFT_94688 [Martensiomyces pterosporus]